MKDIQIKEVVTDSDLKKFVSFPIRLYADNPNYVPPIIEDELRILKSSENPVFKYCRVKMWVALEGKEVVGRVAGIINEAFIDKWARRYARFGWMDFIEDEDVSRSLIEAVEKWALAEGMEALNGPLGFTDFDPEGILIEGFNEKSTIVQRYNASYYMTYLEKAGYIKDADWVEYQITIPDHVPLKFTRASDYLLKKYNLSVIKFNKKEEILPYVREVFSIINDIYGLMYGFVPITNELRDFYISRYLPFLDPELMAIIVDKDNKVVSFGVTMPSLSDVFKKANGSLTKLKAMALTGLKPKTDTVDMYFIGVRPDYLNKGLSAVLISEIGKKLIASGYKFAETNMEFESNEAVQALWKHFTARRHKRRRCYLKYFINSTRIEDNI